MPAVALCTDAFRMSAAAMAKAYGFPGFEYVVTAHPVASLTVTEIQGRVEDMVPRVLEIVGGQR